MEDMAEASGSSGTPSTVEKSPLDFSNEDPPPLITERIGTEEQEQDELSQGISSVGNPPYTEVAPELDLEKETVAIRALVNKRRRKKGMDEAKANAPPEVLRKDHVASHILQSTLGGKSLATIGIGMDSTVFAPATQETPIHAEGVRCDQQLPLGHPGCEPGHGGPHCTTMYFLELRRLPKDEFLNQYNTTLARQVAMGSQLRLRFEQETKLLKKVVAQVARRDQRIHAREKHIKNLEALLEAEADMKDIAEAKNVEIVKELESLRAQVTGEERIKAAFEEFKKYEDDRVSSRCVEMDARLDALSIDFEEELYPHMLTAIVGRRWVIGHGLRLAIMKFAESTELRQVFADVVSATIAKGLSRGFKHGVEIRKAKVDLSAIEAYDPEADTKYVAALHALKDLKYPLVDQLEKLKDAPIDVIMSSLYLESDSREDAPQWIRELRPSSSQLKISVYPEVRNPKNPWSFKEEILLKDAIAANISRAEKKKKCRVVCRTHGVGSAHHASV
nr:hypothetical protein [Tanacetum cinerariifolium]